MAKKNKTRRSTAGSTRITARRASSRARRDTAVGGLTRFGLPLVLCGILVACLGVFGFTFYQSATTSKFFGARSIDVRGTERTSDDDIRRVVTAEVESPGVWNADLGEIKAKIEKFPFVKTAAVSRILPAGVRVDIVERVPEAVVKLSSGNYLVDAEGTVLAKAGPRETAFPIAMHGWDESKTEKASSENVARVKLYKKMLDEWQQFDLVSRVKYVDLSNVREPIATIEDSGRPITVTLARNELGRSLRTAIEAVSGKGSRIKAVNSEGVSPVITYLGLGNEQ